MNSDFFDHLKKFKTNPYLFVGSGLSRRFLYLPTFEDLLKKFFFDSNIIGDFEYFQSLSNNNLPKLAGLLAEEFHEVWWKNVKFKNSRDSNKILAKVQKNIPLKIELSNLIKSSQIKNDSLINEIKTFRNAVIDGIITTNWDTFLNESFPDFNTYIGQQELLFSESISIGEIYKIHGCVSRPDSLVVTDSDYNDFNKRNAYLAAKLLTIFVEHPIIFLGYSLSDPNIQQIIDSIVTCVDSQNLNKLKDRLIFVEWNPGQTFEISDSSIKLPESKVLPIKLIKTDSFQPIFDTLAILKRQIPVKILRKLKNSVVEFVKSSSPSSSIFVKDIDTITDETNIEYAIGVGVASQLLSSQGYRAIEITDIVEDILADNKNFSASKLIEYTFPKMTKGTAYVPVFKYLRSELLLTKSGTLNQTGVNKLKDKFSLKANIPNCFLPTKAYAKKQAEIRRNHKDISSIANAFDTEHAINYIPMLDLKDIDMQDLGNYLLPLLKDKNITKLTTFKKLVCLYDFLKFGLEN